jgi:DNA-binding MarR family transcriptional regulator
MPSRQTASLPSDGVGFLLSQLGHHAATLFAELLEPLELTPALAGIVRMVARQPGLSQQELAQRLDILPSRVVAFIDDLEGRGYITRKRNATDRRLYALTLTSAGRKLMTKLGTVAREHDRRLTAGLSTDQRSHLRGLLTHIAETQTLSPTIHPGYRTLNEPASATASTPRHTR